MDFALPPSPMFDIAAAIADGMEPHAAVREDGRRGLFCWEGSGEIAAPVDREEIARVTRCLIAMGRVLH